MKIHVENPVFVGGACQTGVMTLFCSIDGARRRTNAVPIATQRASRGRRRSATDATGDGAVWLDVIQMWGMSLVIAILVYVGLIPLLHFVAVLAWPTGISGGAGSWSDFSYVWNTMSDDGQNAWAAMGLLLALLMLPITLLVATVLGGDGARTRASGAFAQERAHSLLFATAFSVSVAAWLFLPVVLQPATALFGTALVIGVGLISAVCVSLSPSAVPFVGGFVLLMKI